MIAFVLLPVAAGLVFVYVLMLLADMFADTVNTMTKNERDLKHD